MLGGLLRQSIYLAASKKSQSIKSISNAVDANEGYVREAVEMLFREGLLARTSNGRYRTSFVAFGDEDWSAVSSRLQEHGVNFADALAPHLRTLEGAWNQTSLPERGFPWQKGIWPLCGFFVCAVGMSRHSPVVPVAPRRDSGYRYWMGGYEYVVDERRLWTAEVHSQTVPNGGFGCFASRALDNKGFWFTADQPKVLAAVAKGVPAPESIAAETDLDVERVRQLAAELVQLEVLSRKRDGLALAFPVLGRQEDCILFPEVDRVAELLCRQVVTAATADVPEQLERLGYGHLEEQPPVWREWFRYMTAGEGLRELVRRGVFPDPSSAVPTTFSTVGWLNSSRLFSFPVSNW
jgi:hypothetical protein